MQLVDGRAIADDIYNDLQQRVRLLHFTPSLAIIYVGENPASASFIRLKQKKAEQIGVKTELFSFDANVEENNLLGSIEEIINSKKFQGIIIQLPLPPHLNTQKILNSIPPELDVDVLSEEASKLFSNGKIEFLPAVVGAVDEVSKRYWVTFEEKQVAVVGKGKLVGGPIETWLTNKGIIPTMFDQSSNLQDLKTADIIISGTGSPHLIKGDMVKDGAILIDAGTSEQAGELKGDIDPACADTASIFSSVPGGLGPITVAMLFRNLIVASEGVK